MLDLQGLLSLLSFNGQYVGNVTREWRQAGGHQTAMLSMSQHAHDQIPSPTVSASRKKQKLSQSVPSLSFGVSSQALHPQSVAPASVQPSPSTMKRGPTLGGRGKKFKPVC